MAKQASYVQREEGIDYTATVDIAVGDIVAIGAKKVGIAATNIPISKTGTLKTYGIWDITAKTGEAFSFGDQIHWDPSVKAATKTAADKTVQLGIAVNSKAAAETTARIWLNAI